MRNAIKASILSALLVTSAAAVYAGAPVEGTYKTTNGDFDEGTATHSWVRSYLDGTDLNTMYGRSTSGGVFTNDWTLGCSNAVQMTLLVPKVGPNGHEIWKIDYAPGAYFSLGGPGNPWTGGDAQYVAITDYQTEIRTVQYANDLVVGAVSDHSLAAHFQNYPESCVAWAIGNGTLRGGTGLPGLDGVNFDHSVLQSVKPANYPGFPFGFGNCQLTENYWGHWEDIRDLTLSITGCTVKTQSATWGSVKAMYRN